ncbi:MAG: response regulator [Rickettsiales bacterium]|nr:response regulator [Rickettsiales bacterium]
MTDPNSIHTRPDHFTALQSDYAAYLASQFAEFSQLRALLMDHPAQAEALVRVYQLVHQVSGSAANFGFPAISQNGQRLCGQIKPLLEHSPAQWHTLLDAALLKQHLDMFDRACKQALSPSSLERSVTEPNGAMAVQQRSVCIFSSDGEVFSDIAEQLRHFGYVVNIRQDANSFKAALAAERPDVLIIHSDMSEADVQRLASLQLEVGAPNMPLQLIMVSKTDTFEARLAAVRLGAQGYFTLPADVLQVIDKIEYLVGQYREAQSYHVLIVDDDEMLMKFYTHALMRSGIITTSVSNPKDALSVIADQAVDLILIDYLMPHCNGRELATIIRQHEKYVSMPIIFMSARDDVESLLIDTGLGIDDFLVKPITGDQLVSVVRSRARRSAELQVLMARDSFTGLLNHGHFMDMLGMELTQVKRYKTHGAYAIIDIDHFKQINDTYGHIAGDHVIKGLSRMLQQRLRRSDIIGRCGGE